MTRLERAIKSAREHLQVMWMTSADHRRSTEILTELLEALEEKRHVENRA